MLSFTLCSEEFSEQTKPLCSLILVNYRKMTFFLAPIRLTKPFPVSLQGAGQWERLCSPCSTRRSVTSRCSGMLSWLSADSPAALCSLPQGRTAKVTTTKTVLLCCLHSAGVWRPLLAQLRRGNARTCVRVRDFPALEEQHLPW